MSCHSQRRAERQCFRNFFSRKGPGLSGRLEAGNSTTTKVPVLDEGRLTALGPPGELAESDAYYSEALSLSGMRP